MENVCGKVLLNYIIIFIKLLSMIENIWVFGSSLKNRICSNDIDVAIISDERFHLELERFLYANFDNSYVSKYSKYNGSPKGTMFHFLLIDSTKTESLLLENIFKGIKI